MKTFVGHAHQVYAVAFDGVRVATGSLDSTVRLWSPETGYALLPLPSTNVPFLRFDPNRRNCTAILQGHTSLVGQLQLLSSTLVTGGSDGRAIIFSLPPTTPIPSSSAPSCLSSSSSSPSSPIPPATLHRLCAHDNSITCLQFDDRFLITGGSDGHVKLFELKTGVLIRELTEPCEAVWRVCFREDKCVVMCKRGGRTVMEILSFRPSEEA